MEYAMEYTIYDEVFQWEPFVTMSYLDSRYIQTLAHSEQNI